jgi:putative glutamine amidotransferase
VKDLAPGLLATGWTDDDLIEAVESPAGSPWILAVQWHPEEMHADARAPEHGLFAALVEACDKAGRELVGEVVKEESVTHAVQRTP